MAGEDRDTAVAPNRRIRRKTVLILASVLTAVVLLLILLCHFVGIRSTSDIVAYRAMRREHYHPIWKDLALGWVKRGDDVESLVKKYTPLWRNDAGAYTKLVYTQGGADPGLTVMAKDGKLILAVAGAATWQHVFFDAPGQMESYAQAHSEYRKQLRLDKDAYRIHCAVTTGQDVFLSDHIEPRDLLDNSASDAEMMKQLAEIYGKRYVQRVPVTTEELTVEVKEVLYGDFTPGATLTFPKGRCDDADLNEPETVFLSTKTQGETLYTTVPRSALDWYQSLTPEQIQGIVARWSAK